MSWPLLLSLSVVLAAPQGWQLVVATGGGAGGRGKGGIELRSTGELFVRPYVGAPCEFRVSAEEMARVREAVEAARPSSWRARYVLASNPSGAGDQYATLLFLTAARGRIEEQWGTGWFDDARKLAPMDAQRLAATGLALMKSHACKPRRS
ncbi:MAG: hypothetical protein HZB56_06270 [Deltaproteobacteria bacterium]|nr:hypothetical protein [Deltaproteobacteria bacterium]